MSEYIYSRTDLFLDERFIIDEKCSILMTHYDHFYSDSMVLMKDATIAMAFVGVMIAGVMRMNLQRCLNEA